MTRYQALLALIIPLAVVVSAPAQFGPLAADRTGVPLFQINPYLAQAGYQQNVVNQAALAQGGLAAGLPPSLPGVPGLSNRGGFARISSVSGGMDSLTQSYGQQPNSSFNPYGQYNPYFPYCDPFGGSLRGLADLTLSYGQYQQDYQRGRLLNQEVERAKIETRLRLYQEWRYYQSLQPTAEDVRLASLERDLSRARRAPPASEILSARSLNDLLGYLKDAQARGRRGPGIPLDEDTLVRINVAPENGGNNALLKQLARQDGRLNWPLALKTPVFNEIRERMEIALRNAIDRVRANGRVDDALLGELRALRKELEDTLDLNATRMSLPDVLEARRYVDWISDAVRALADPNVANYFNRTYQARGKTVADLIDYMTRTGLRFAPAVNGDEAAYRALYTALAAYDEGLRVASNR